MITKTNASGNKKKKKKKILIRQGYSPYSHWYEHVPAHACHMITKTSASGNRKIFNQTALLLADINFIFIYAHKHALVCMTPQPPTVFRTESKFLYTNDFLVNAFIQKSIFNQTALSLILFMHTSMHWYDSTSSHCLQNWEQISAHQWFLN